jgi:hypothetical protein
MARRKSSHRRHRIRTRHAKRARHTKRSRHTKRTRRTRRGGDGSIGTPYPGTRMMPLNPNQTLDGGYFSRPNQIGGSTSTCTGGTLQPSGSVMNAGCSNGQMATRLVTGGRA